ncbi:MAG: DUF6688 family protein [Clostridium sp.]
MKYKILKHIISISFVCAVMISCIQIFFSGDHYNSYSVGEILLVGASSGIVCIHPILLTVINLFFLLQKSKNEWMLESEKRIEYLTLGEGSIYMLALLSISNIIFKDWTEVLSNMEKHTPIWTGGILTIAVLAAVSVAGYLFLACTQIQKTPPLISVGAMAGMYLGMILCVLWIVQIFSVESSLYVYLCLFPFNCVILGMKLIRLKIIQWREKQPEKGTEFRNSYLNYLNLKLMNSTDWPLAAFLLMWPLLAVLICILILFGQRPDSVVRAWTETGDWNLSTKVPPQNVTFDEHYLCTVAAGGHKKVVKPIRMGERHGHRVVVNRQLCIANAFEQILEERTPVFHRHLRHVYDTYGFPIARWIHSPYTADCIYFLMKPLEWIFLIVLYCCDINPENRIAIQYLPRRRKF